MTRPIIQRTGHAAPWLAAEPQIVDGDVVAPDDAWTDDIERAATTDDAALARALGAEVVWLGGPPQVDVGAMREAERQAAVSALIVERARSGDPDALAAAIARAERGDERAAEFLATCECAVEREESVEPAEEPREARER